MGYLITESGPCTIEEIKNLPIPARTSSYQPISNKELIDMLCKVAQNFDLTLLNSKWGMSRQGQRVFGTYEIKDKMNLGGQAKFMLGIRNSTDKSVSAGICFGSEVCVCSNLVFTGYADDRDISGKTFHKHTTNIKNTLYQRLGNSLSQFEKFREYQDKFYNRLGSLYIDDKTAYSTIVRAVLAGAMPNKDVVRVAQNWIESGNPIFRDKENWHKEFVGRNAWSLFNVFTENHKIYTEKNPVEANKRSITLTKFFHNRFMN